MKEKRVYKFATGEAIPEGAVYLNTVVQTKIAGGHMDDSGRFEYLDCHYVWHYFLVEVRKDL